jgi:hypothetical protein
MMTTSADILFITFPFMRFMKEISQKMQGAPSIKNSDDTVRILMDELIRGNMHWPCASLALADTDIFLNKLPEADREWLLEHARVLRELSAAARRSFIEGLERDDRATFHRVLKALYAAYYTSPQVIERVIAFAMSGPAEPSPVFDGTLVQNVIRTQAGKRRL